MTGNAADTANGNANPSSGAAQPRQRTAVILTTITVLTAVSLYLALTAIALVCGTFDGNKGTGWLLGLMMMAEMPQLILTSIPYLLGIGTALLARPDSNGRLFWIATALAAFACVASLALWLAFLDGDNVQAFTNTTRFSTLSVAENFRAGTNRIFLPLAGWAFSVFAALVGVQLAGSKK
jgi:hypothetical protein